MYHLGAIEPAPSCAPEPSCRGDGWQGPAEAAPAWALPPLLPSAPPPTGAAAQAPGAPGVEARAPGRRLGLSLIPSASVSLRALRGPLRLPPDVRAAGRGDAGLRFPPRRPAEGSRMVPAGTRGPNLPHTGPARPPLLPHLTSGPAPPPLRSPRGSFRERKGLQGVRGRIYRNQGRA